MISSHTIGFHKPVGYTIVKVNVDEVSEGKASCIADLVDEVERSMQKYH